ncbi:hypothetical protein CEXT_625061 [Caerostris extrusa]|uniref:Uncharacterized protein n=1 Tax=Caerostris extrusa TaxID=172846 RepID=A0AAV4RVK5_CAEEX|nr:hypothetical protein CEXT_625061 [Caerostris extrusa]
MSRRHRIRKLSGGPAENAESHEGSVPRSRQTRIICPPRGGLQRFGFVAPIVSHQANGAVESMPFRKSDTTDCYDSTHLLRSFLRYAPPVPMSDIADSETLIISIVFFTLSPEPVACRNNERTSWTNESPQSSNKSKDPPSEKGPTLMTFHPTSQDAASSCPQQPS